ncbi:hypothetical protein F4561_002215 [Lipingzhangella halophila]|uniref:Uncharacterized protein n=1 Tax=Lipingzhangella halophila TaxID=1783352 RepID=A0A7W7W354_9ACTN|nr:hypothetical protein [Lipingzhangella halophila]MBB4931395.1 hypothetical protein [Lipingzhangella halophila]
MFRRAREPGVVDQVANQTKQAADLATINDQALTDPRTNPAVRGHHDQLRNVQQRRQLDLEHRRALRRGRVSDSRAAAAERALAAVDAARETASPARAVLALTRTRTRYLAGCLAASVVCSVGSALSIVAWLGSAYPSASAGLGWVVESGLTILATSMILLRGRLSTVTGAAPTGWRSHTLWALIGGPLAVSVGLSTAGAGLVGAACSLGAAAWAVAAFLATDTLSVAVEKSMGRVDSTDEAELRETAMGEDVFTPRAAPVAPGRVSGWVDAGPRARLPIVPRVSPPSVTPDTQPDTASWVGEVEQFLADRQDPPEGGVAPRLSPGDDTGPAGAAHTAPDATTNHRSECLSPPRQTDREEPTERAVPAAEAQRLLGEDNRRRVAEYLVYHPGATNRDVAEALDLTERTVQRHRTALRGES